MSMFAVKSDWPSTQAVQLEDESCFQPRHVNSLSPALPVPLALSPTVALSPESKYLLDHYLHRTGKMASAHIGAFTPFTDSLLPIAHSSNVLLESMLTFSSFHLAARAPHTPPVNTFEHHALALRSVKLGITQYASGDKEAGLQLFLSMVMLCCVELANGGQDESAFRHLNALRRLAPSILAAPGMIPEAYKPAMTFGIELYAYLLTVSCNSSLGTTDDPSILQDTAFVFSNVAEQGYTGAMFGCSAALFRLIPEVITVLREARHLGLPHDCSKTAEKTSQACSVTHGVPDEATDPSLKIASLMTTVSAWEPPESSDITFQISGKILKLAMTVLLVEASFWHTTVERALDENMWPDPEASKSPSVLSGFQSALSLEYQTTPLVAEFVALLETLPVQSCIATTMCWPMAVLGSYAILQPHRIAVRQYLLSMEAIFGFRNMTRTRMLLEYIWSKIETFETDLPMDIAEAMTALGDRFLLG